MDEWIWTPELLAGYVKAHNSGSKIKLCLTAHSNNSDISFDRDVGWWTVGFEMGYCYFGGISLYRIIKGIVYTLKYTGGDWCMTVDFKKYECKDFWVDILDHVHSYEVQKYHWNEK
jgi:hypothetical protein